MVRNLQGRASLQLWHYFQIRNWTARSQEGGERILPTEQKYRPQEPWWSGLAQCHWGIAYHFVKTKLFEIAGMGFLPQVMWNYCSGLFRQSTKGKCESSLRSGLGEADIFAGGLNHTGRWNVQTGESSTHDMTWLQEVCTMHILHMFWVLT